VRARNIKPGFFINEDLAEVDAHGRLLFIGLWCLADREGKLEDRPKRIKGELFRYDAISYEIVDEQLSKLNELGLIIRYEIDGLRYIFIPNFLKHQSPHYNEKPSTIPDPLLTKVESTSNQGSNKEPMQGGSLPPDSLNPDSLNPDKKDMSPPEGGNGFYPQDFEAIYLAYPKNQHGSKKNAYGQFKKVKALIPKDVIPIIKRQIAEKQKADSLGIFYPEFKHFERWLKAAEWEREPFDFDAVKPKEEQPQWVRELSSKQSTN